MDDRIHNNLNYTFNLNDSDDPKLINLNIDTCNSTYTCKINSEFTGENNNHNCENYSILVNRTSSLQDDVFDLHPKQSIMLNNIEGQNKSIGDMLSDINFILLNNLN